MEIVHKHLSELKPYANNPRVNDGAVAAVVASIREFGFRQPVVVDADMVIIVGHTRFKAAQQLGMSEVPVHIARDLTPAQLKAYRIADNQVATIATWDKDLLPIELGELEALDFDLKLLGFDDDQLAKHMGTEVQDGQCDPDDVPLPPDAAITQPGDLWILGSHRLLCGDSSNPVDLDRLLNGQPIHLCNTDPPYNVKVEPRSNNAIAAGLSSFPMTSAKGSSDARGMHHQGFDLARDKSKAKGTTKDRRNN
jgi:ParB-like chromosome segregation protein Spo0J